jgi:acetyl esterase/lipase
MCRAPRSTSTAAGISARSKRLAGAAAAIALLGYAAHELSPWPAALVYRFFLNWGGERLNQALEKHVPAGVSAALDQEYQPGVFLDVYHPAQASGALPTIVWFHGGGFFAGDKAHVGNYLKILAARGYTTVAVGYSLAPGSHYPTPLRQGNAALAYLARHAPRLRVDPRRFFFAGDSAGAQLATQLANIATSSAYAAEVGIEPSITRAQLRGVILHCGVYDLELGPPGHFMRTAAWAYSGRKDAKLAEISVARYVTANFPPAFISVGNADPLEPHSRALARALSSLGVRVDALFFDDGHEPELPHEYQFNLDTEAGRLALERTVEFLRADARVVGEGRRRLVDEERARIAGRGAAGRRQAEQHGGGS